MAKGSKDMKTKKPNPNQKKCSACGVPIRTSILRQCEKCIRERRGL